MNYTIKDRKVCPGYSGSDIIDQPVELSYIIGYPALSRYGHGDICSDCGVREALQGDFIGKRKAAIKERVKAVDDAHRFVNELLD